MAGTRAGLLQLPGYYGDEYYFYLWAGEELHGSIRDYLYS